MSTLFRRIDNQFLYLLRSRLKLIDAKIRLSSLAAQAIYNLSGDLITNFARLNQRYTKNHIQPKVENIMFFISLFPLDFRKSLEYHYLKNQQLDQVIHFLIDMMLKVVSNYTKKEKINTILPRHVYLSLIEDIKFNQLLKEKFPAFVTPVRELKYPQLKVNTKALQMKYKISSLVVNYLVLYLDKLVDRYINLSEDYLQLEIEKFGLTINSSNKKELIFQLISLIIDRIMKTAQSFNDNKFIKYQDLVLAVNIDPILNSLTKFIVE